MPFPNILKYWDNRWLSQNLENKIHSDTYLRIQLVCTKVQVHSSLEQLLEYNYRALARNKKNLCFAWIAVFSIWKALQVLRKAHIKIVARAIYTHLFFYFTYTLLFCWKVKSCCGCYFPQENKNIIVWGLVSIWQSTHTACSNPAIPVSIQQMPT